MNPVEHRERRRRHRRRPDASTGDGRGQETVPSWDWRTFPVAFAFATGAFVMGLFAGVPVVNLVLFVIAMAAVALGLAHIFARQVIGGRRARNSPQRYDRGGGRSG